MHFWFASQILAPSAPPVEVTGVALNSRSLRISWDPPPEKTRNGKITVYKVLYMESSKPADPSMATIKTVDGEKTQVTLNNLNTWTEYRVWVLAGTAKGEGPLSEAIYLKTDEAGKLIISIKLPLLAAFIIVLLLYLFSSFYHFYSC